MSVAVESNRQQAERASRGLRLSDGLLPLTLLLALAIRLLLWSQPLHEPANDEIEYIAVARDLLAGRGWAFYDSWRWLRAPLYPLFLAGSLQLVAFGAPVSSSEVLHRAALPTIALSIANVYLIYRLALVLVGRRPALLAAMIAAALLPFATFASLYMAETLFTFLFTGGLLCALHAVSKSGRIRWWLIALAGLLIGLATLTRSITLLFVPVIAAWLVVRVARNAHATVPPYSALLAGCLLPVALCLVIAPWSIRNALAYGELIVVETGLSYNMWAFNEPRETLDEIHRTLEAIPNPAERAAFATERGLARLREDPAILLRKIWPNWVFLARVKPIQDRFLLESYYASVELPLFAAALLFDDLLYVVIGLGAIWGLCGKQKATESHELHELHKLAPIRVNSCNSWLRSRGLAPRVVRFLMVVAQPKALCLLWIGYAIATMLLTHGEARYRQFLFPIVIPYAAWAIVQVGSGFGSKMSQLRWRRPAAFYLLPSALSLVFLWTVLTTYPWDWAAENTARGWHTLAGDLRWVAGDRAGALASYEQAIEAHNVPDAWITLAEARRALGDTPGALQAYRRAWRRERLYFPASTRLGDLLRQTGDEAGARTAFAGQFADPRRVAEWAWRHLRPAPRAALDVGNGLDVGYIDGFEPAEEIAGASARWTNGRAELRLHAPPEGAGALRLRLAAPRLDDQPIQAEVCVGATCHTIEVGPTWRIYLLPLDVPPSHPLNIQLRSSTFIAPDGRALGCLIDYVAIIPARSPGSQLR